MTMAAGAPILDRHQARQNIDFFNTISALCELATCAAKVGYRKFASSVMGSLRAVTRRMHSRHLKQRECLNQLEPTVWIVILGGCCL